MADDLDMNRLKEVLDYDPETGIFTWKIASGHRSVVGGVAGSPGPKGVWQIRFDNKAYHAHRLAFFYVNGRWPEGNLVVDGDKHRPKISELREESRAETVARGKVRSTNTSGFRGVSWNSDKGKWVASITRDYRRVHLGEYHTKEEASEAYEEAVNNGVPQTRGTIIPKDPKSAKRSRWASFATIQRDPSLVGWNSIESFIVDMGAPPTEDHILTRIRHSADLGPGNAQWRLPWNFSTGIAGAKHNYHLGRFGINDADYQKMLVEQNGVCAICGRPERQGTNGSPKQLSVDHDHETGELRGLLCTSCNTALGLVEDRVDLLHAAIAYLTKKDHRNG